MNKVLKQSTEQENQTATAGECNNKLIFINSSDYGNPHIHYDKIKIFLPDREPVNTKELKQYVDKKNLKDISNDELIKLVKWFREKSNLNNKLTNYEMALVLWKAEH